MTCPPNRCLQSEVQPELAAPMANIPDVSAMGGKAKRGCASRVPLPSGETACRMRGVLVVRATPAFGPLVRHAGGQRGTGVGTPFALLAGRSHHIDPWREGQNAEDLSLRLSCFTWL